ncbi:MAG: hypothetical protein ACKVIR_00615 [Candidatus Poseidoniales archaeon]
MSAIKFDPSNIYTHFSGSNGMDNESSVYTVIEMNSIKDKQLKDPHMIEFRKNAGVDPTSLEIIALVE